MQSETDRALDEYLVLLAKGGSRLAFDRLARRWTPRLLRFVARRTGSAELARDIVQEIWVGVVQGLGRYTSGHSFPAWIYSIAHRRCVDSMRGARRRRLLAESASVDADVQADSGTVEPDAGEAADLTSALHRLGAEHRDVLSLFYGEDLGVQEIAIVLAIPPGTVKSRLHHARQLLKAYLGE